MSLDRDSILDACSDDSALALAVSTSSIESRSKAFNLKIYVTLTAHEITSDVCVNTEATCSVRQLFAVGKLIYNLNFLDTTDRCIIYRQQPFPNASE